MSAFQRHAACHDHADIARAEDDDLRAGHPVVEVQVSLRGACGEHARRTLAGNAQCAAAALLAACLLYTSFSDTATFLFLAAAYRIRPSPPIKAVISSR